MTTSMTRRRWFAGFVLVPMAAVVLGACTPAPAPGPNIRPSSVSCTAGGALDALELCHLQYAPYRIDTANGAAQARADSLARTVTVSICLGNLGSQHTDLGLLQFTYGGSRVAVAENIYCWFSSNQQCPAPTDGATFAMNGWIGSPGHRANLDRFAGMSVNAGAACIPPSGGGPGVYVAVAQFHNP